MLIVEGVVRNLIEEAVLEQKTVWSKSAVSARQLLFHVGVKLPELDGPPCQLVPTATGHFPN
jgi:hypothetical protein